MDENGRLDHLCSILSTPNFTNKKHQAAHRAALDPRSRKYPAPAVRYGDLERRLSTLERGDAHEKERITEAHVYGQAAAADRLLTSFRKCHRGDRNLQSMKPFKPTHLWYRAGLKEMPESDGLHVSIRYRPAIN